MTYNGGYGAPVQTGNTAIGLDALIPVINKLQDAFTLLNVQDPIDLPQIVVVGSQSSGKSSVLEHIVGRDFLPRGSGIVTRRPLVLQLIHTTTPVGVPEVEGEWGEFLHVPGKKFFDFGAIRDEIEKDTERVTGRGKAISSKPINLKIFSPHVVNLTLVDLPGITKVPVHDQPTDIEKQIRRMVLNFIEPKNAIIVAITPANSDLANSDSIKIARAVDPEGNRTIGVLTKIDIMDRGTDAADMLQGRIVPLKLGFVGVINRSQDDINRNLPIRAAVEKEAKFFRNHSSYRTLASKMGTGFLSSRLNKLLLNHIRDTLPDLKNRIASMMSQTQQELLQYGDEIMASPSKGALLLQILTKFSSDYREMIEGSASDQPTEELYGGARIQYIFNDIFTSGLVSLDPCDGLSTNDIRTAIRNATGPRPTLFIPESSFELLVKRQIAMLEEPAGQCVDYVFEELVRIISQLELKDLQRFQSLRERVVDTASNLLRKCLIPTNQMIQSLIQIELSYINTNHPDFVGGTAAISGIVEELKNEEAEQTPEQKRPVQQTRGEKGDSQRRPKAPPHIKPQPTPTDGAHSSSFFKYFFGGKEGGPPGTQGAHKPHREGEGGVTLDRVPTTLKADGQVSDREKLETDLIRTLLTSYFNIVRKNIMDSVPKAVMYLLVNSSRDQLQHELVSNLYREELFEDLLKENSAVAERRKQCQDLLKVLRRANDIVGEVRDISSIR